MQTREAAAGGALLIGVDLVKPVEVLEAAVALAPEEMVPTVALANALTVSSRARQAVR